MSQDTLLLNESLRENLVYGKQDVDEVQLKEILNQARLDEFAGSLPNGLDTLIGDRGVQLSGGERQRVSLARALLKGSSILILDEATSALDVQTEKLIQDAVQEAIQGKTAIVIAHRLSTIRNADKVIVLEDGRCVEEGSPSFLLEKNGLFKKLWDAQQFS